MTLRRIMTMVATVSIAAIALTCKDSPSGNSGATAGFVSIQMTTPNGDDGGVMFIITGGPVDSLRSSYPNVLTRNESAAATRVVVGGNLAAGKIAEFWIPDLRKATLYTAALIEVAARGSFAQRPVTSYTLTVARPD